MKDGVWRTIGGRRVFIKDGQDLSDAMKESGKFKNKTEGMTFEEYEKEMVKKHMPGGRLSKKHFDKLKELGLTDEEIKNISANDVYDRDSEGIRNYKTKEQYKVISKRKDDEKKARKEEEKSWELERETKQKIQQEIKNKTIKREGISERQYDKEEKAERYREKKEEELELIGREIRGQESGYYNGKKSIRSIRAEMEGVMPVSEASKMLGVTPSEIKKYSARTEWHHTGGSFYNETDFYNVSKYIDLANNGISDYINEPSYETYIINWLKMRKSKKTIEDYR